jgi:hypothetical protein
LVRLEVSAGQPPIFFFGMNARWDRRLNGDSNYLTRSFMLRTAAVLFCTIHPDGAGRSTCRACESSLTSMRYGSIDATAMIGKRPGFWPQG